MDLTESQMSKATAVINRATTDSANNAQAIMTTPLATDDIETEKLSKSIEQTEEEDLNPPENFAMVSPYIYRSGMPKKRNFQYLKKLRLKSVLTLILEEYPDQTRRFLVDNNIKLYQFGVAGNKEPFADIPEDIMSQALVVLMDRRNHPILVHCNKGKHRTGCLVGCLRKLQEWTNTSIFDEYRRYANPKARSMDQQFIELFDVRPVLSQIDPLMLPDWPTTMASPSRLQ